MSLASPRPPLHLEERRELLRLFLRQGRQGFLVGMLLAILMAGLLWLLADLPLAGVWAGALAGVSLFTIGRMTALLPTAADLDAAAIDQAERHYTLLSGLTGMCWGTLFWGVIQGHGQEQALLYTSAILVVGITSVATAMLAPLPKTGPAFVLPVLLPFSLMMFLQGGSLHVIAAVLLFFGAFAILFLGRTYHHTLAEGIRLRLENIALVEELRAEKQIAEDASRIKSLFLAGVSHDLKHPLNALGLYLGYLKTRQSESEAAAGVARSLPHMEEALGGMGNLLSRLLELSRLEAGEYLPHPRPLSLQHLLQRCEAQFTAAASAKGIRLRFVPTRATLMADPFLLQSILDNLVGNAVRYTEHGGIVVGMRHRDGHPVIQVADSGPGIPEELIPLLFEAYRRFDDARRGSEGYGLGLALVKKQCELAGYTIQVRSTPGRGSLFSVRLG